MFDLMAAQHASGPRRELANQASAGLQIFGRMSTRETQARAPSLLALEAREAAEEPPEKKDGAAAGPLAIRDKDAEESEAPPMSVASGHHI